MVTVNHNYLKLPGSYLFSTIGKKVKAYKEANPQANVISLGIGDVTQPLAPAIIEALHKSVDEMGDAATFHGYAPDLGYEFLRSAIAKNDYKDRGCDIEADEIFVSDGAKSDSGNIQEIFGLDNKIAVCDPVYPVYVDTNVMAGRTGEYNKERGNFDNVIYMPCTASNGFLPEFPEEVPDLIYLCFPNNPTGSLIPEDMMKEIVEIARSSGAYILCDEVYAGVSIEGAACPSIADLYEKGIATGSMSKAFSLAGLRLGWLATKSQEALRQFKRVRDYDLVSCGLFDEETAALALRHKEKILERNRAILRENLPILDAWVKEEPRTSYVRPRAGTMALVYYDLDIDSNIFSQRMFKETGAFAVPGTCFEERRALRIGYGHDGEALKEGLSVVSSFMRKLEEEGIPVIKE